MIGSLNYRYMSFIRLVHLRAVREQYTLKRAYVYDYRFGFFDGKNRLIRLN